jgi:predicted DNA-binding transcriptional regulator AlpA
VRSVATLFDAGISTIWARVARGELPKPRKFGRSTRWRVGDLRAVLAGAQ